MNREAIKELIEILKKTNTFDQTRFFNSGNPCGTPACIAGHALAMRGFIYYMTSPGMCVHPSAPDSRFFINEQAAEILGLDSWDAEELFSPWPDVSKYDAVATLERLLDTGRVEWQGAQP